MAVTEQVLIVLKAKDEASKIINGISKDANVLAKTFKATMGVAAIGATAALGSISAAIGVGVKKAADMEQQIADIASVMNVTAGEAAPLKDLITQLGIDPKLKVDATEAADAIQMLARNGLSMSEILDGAARSTVLLANATNADFGTAADIATDAMALFNITADNMAQAVNGIAGVTTNSKFSIDDYKLALSQAGGVAAATGVDFGDFNTAIATTAPYFASGSDAGTSFKSFLTRLVPTTKDAEAAMVNLGLMTADGSNQFFDASGNMKSMSEIAGLLQVALAGLSDAEKSAALDAIFLSDGSRTAVALAEVGAPAFNELAGSIGKVDAEGMAATRMDTFSGALEILQGIMDGLLMQIGDAFLPSLKNITNWAIAFTDAHGPAVVEWFRGLSGWLTAGVPVFVEWSQKAVWAIGEVVNWLHGGQEQFTNLNAIWGKVTTIVSGVIDTTIAYVRAHWQDWVNVLMEWGNLFASWANTLWSNSIQPGLTQMWGALSAWLDEHAGGLGTKLATWGGAFASMIDGALRGWRDAWPKISQTVADASGKIGEDVDRILESLGKMGAWFQTADGKTAAYSWAQFWGDLVHVVSGVLAQLMDQIANFTEAISKVGEWFAAIKALDFGRASELNVQIRELARLLGRSPFEIGLELGLQGHAAGGPVRSGMPYMVGEHGPELFVPEGNGRIVPNNQIDNRRSLTIENINLQGSGNAGADVLSSIQILTALYAA